MSPKKDKCEKIVKNSVLWSMGAGLIPLPLVDMVAVTGIQIDMLKQITAVYEIDFSENQFKSWIAALSGGILSRLGANALKVVPGIGSMLGGVAMSVLSGAGTYAIGQVFLKHFEEGGDAFNFDTEKFKGFYEEQFEKGKKFAKDLAKEKKAEKTEAQNVKTDSKEDVMAKLRELTEMYQKGILTEKEFSKLKKKLLKNM